MFVWGDAVNTPAVTEVQQRLVKPSYLVQRLLPPIGARSNPFSFGGGLRNGGLSEEAMELIKDAFSFDYMGRAEFEFGAVPQALHSLAGRAEQERLTAFSFEVLLSKVMPAWGEVSPPKPRAKAPVYVICEVGYEDAVKEFIRLTAAAQARLNEPSLLGAVLRPGKHLSRVRGWLELDNGFFFFTDETMWRNTATIFGIEC